MTNQAYLIVPCVLTSTVASLYQHLMYLSYSDDLTIQHGNIRQSLMMKPLYLTTAGQEVA